jgi:hypothetical protein
MKRLCEWAKRRRVNGRKGEEAKRRRGVMGKRAKASDWRIGFVFSGEAEIQDSLGRALGTVTKPAISPERGVTRTYMYDVIRKCRSRWQISLLS